jgi:hypothetical protein
MGVAMTLDDAVSAKDILEPDGGDRRPRAVASGGPEHHPVLRNDKVPNKGGESGMMRAICLPAAVLGVLLVGASSARALEPGRAAGTFTYNGTKAALTIAVETTVEGLFDPGKKDTLIVLTDRALGTTAPDDDIELSLRARRGDITALVLRVHGGKLTDVSAYHEGLNGKTLLPGAWFQYTNTVRGTGSLRLAPRKFEDDTYACAVEFSPGTAPAAPVAAPVEATSPVPREPEPKLPPATTANIDPKTLTTMLIQALMQRDEHQALEIVKLGADPNGRDDYGIPMLNWAVMMCQPKVVKALVDKKASLTYRRAPGMTIMVEAGACPEAAAILRAAGAK